MRKILALLVSCSVVACTDITPTPPAQRSAALLRTITGGGAEIPRFPELDSAYEVRLGRTLAPELDDAALVAAVRSTTGRVIIGLKPITASRTQESGIVPAMSRAAVLAAREVLLGRSAILVRTFRFSSDVVADIPPELAPEIRRLSVVNYLSPDYVASLGIQDTAWGVKKIGAHLVWQNYLEAGNYATVTILDSGIDSTHWIDLSLDGPANVLNCMYVPPDTSTCFQTKPIHGSAVAGVINARNNSVGYIGIAPQLSAFNSVRICMETGGCPYDVMMAGLDWAMGSGYPRHIVNISIQGCQDSAPLASKIAAAVNAGILIVSIAGNTDFQCSPSDPPGATGVTFPGRFPQVLAVSGTTPDDLFADPGIAPCTGGGSRYGPEVDLSAPFWTVSMWAGGTWQTVCGTSFSAPTVAAAAALVWSANPSWSAGQVWARLEQSSVDLPPAGADSKFGKGRVSAMRSHTFRHRSRWFR